MGVALFLLAWQVMIAALMLPSSLPLVRLFATASAKAPRAGVAMAAFLSAYVLVWAAFGALALTLDLALHSLVETSQWLYDHQWLIGGSVLALAGAFQFTKLKDACLDRCRHPAAFIRRYYQRASPAPSGSARATAHSAWAAAGHSCW